MMTMRSPAVGCLVVALLAGTSGLGRAAETAGRAPPDPHCGLFAKVQQTLSTSIGRQVDPLTRFEGIDVSCDRKAIVFRQDVRLNSTDLGPDWIARRSRHWSKTYCTGQTAYAAAIRSGWTISTRIHLADGRALTLNADCHDADA